MKTAFVGTNISKNDAKNAVEIKYSDGFHLLQRGLRHIYFEPKKGNIDFQLTEMDAGRSYISATTVSLNPDNYGFCDDYRVRIRPKKIDLEANGELSIKLSQPSRERFRALLNKNEESLNTVLEEVGAIINDSVLYEASSGIKELREAENQLKQKTGYVPNGTDVQAGDCGCAGTRIRFLLNFLDINAPIKYIKTRPLPPRHDTTVVFDFKSGVFAVINSKSPRYGFNLASKNNLVSLGITYPDFCKELEDSRLFYEQILKESGKYCGSKAIRFGKHCTT